MGEGNLLLNHLEVRVGLGLERIKKTVGILALEENYLQEAELRRDPPVWLSVSGVQDHVGGNDVLRALKGNHWRQGGRLGYLSLAEFSETGCVLSDTG